MTPHTNIFLIGFMGTGKTTVGRALAAALGLRFVDMDDEIVKLAGKPIARIFSEDGEPRFRAYERGVAHDLSQGAGQVVATGGGVVLDPRNMADFAVAGLVVCLTARPEIILQRVAGDASRPLLAGTTDEKVRKVASLLDRRKDLYAAAPHQVDTSALAIGQVVSRIVALYRRSGCAQTTANNTGLLASDLLPSTG